MNPDFPSQKLDPAQAVVSVGELNRMAARLLERGFPLLWVAGEISNLTRASSGHWYFTLKDREAQVRCAMFRGRNQLLDWAPANGDHVEARASVGLYAPRGEFQLTVEHLRRAGSGALFEAFQKLKEKLAAEGLFAPERKPALPRVVRAIGVVTSTQAAALRDVLTTIRRRAPHVRVVVYPTPVQGKEAPERLCAALRVAADRARRLGETDLLLLVRGGGSLEDLWAYNDETLARCIAALEIPVIAGIGHETDFTIADFVAAVRAPTPTAAAELATPDGPAYRRRLIEQAAALARRTERRLAASAQRLDDLERRLRSPAQRMRERAQMLARLSAQLQQAGHTLAEARGARVALAASRLARRRPSLAPLLATLDTWVTRLVARMAKGLAERDRALQVARARLEALNPHAALARGYALVTDSAGHVVTDAATLAPNTDVEIAFARGMAVARVLRTAPPKT